MEDDEPTTSTYIVYGHPPDDPSEQTTVYVGTSQAQAHLLCGRQIARRPELSWIIEEVSGNE
jgi:hypothetical protein